MDPSLVNQPSETHPPMMPGAVPPPHTVWPTVLGIIAIIMGSMGALQGVVALIMPLFADQFRKFGSMSGGGAVEFDMFAGVDEYGAWLTLSSVLTMVVGLLLILGGAMLAKRKRIAGSVILTWAAVKIMLVVGSTLLGFLINRAQMESLTLSPNAPPQMMSMMDAMAYVSIVLGLCWGWVLPIFMIAWFVRPTIRGEMSTW